MMLHSIQRWSVSAMLLISLLFLSMVGALHEDEAGVVDWHHKLIGSPLQDSTFLHKPVAGSGALAYTVTDRDVVAALLLSDGSIVWRQLIPQPKLARPLDDAIAVLSGNDTTVVTTFDAQTGHQVLQSASFSGSPLDMEILSHDWPENDARDIVTLSSNGYIRRFHHLQLAWETSSIDIKGEPRYIATSLSKIYVVYTVPHTSYSGATTSYGVTVTTLDAVTGKVIDIHQHDAFITPPDNLRVVGSHSSAPLAIWLDKDKLRANVLGSRAVSTLETDIPDSPSFSFSVLAPHSSTSLPHFLVSFIDAGSSWANVYHINLSAGSISRAYALPKTPKGTYSLAQVDANIFFAKVTLEFGREEADFEVWGSTSHARLNRWTVPFPTSQYGLAGISVLEAVSRDDSVAARAMLTTQDGSIHLLRNSHSWTREESLSHINPTQTLFLDLPVPEPSLKIRVSPRNILSAYLNRVTSHILQLRNLPSTLARFAKHFATGSYEEIELGSKFRDAFGLRKFIIVSTTTGKLLALDSANGGTPVWTKLLPFGSKIEGMGILRQSNAVRGYPPLLGVVVKEGSLYKLLQINGLDGSIRDEAEVFYSTGDIVKLFPVPSGLLATPSFKEVESVLIFEGKDPLMYVSDRGYAGLLPGTCHYSDVRAQIEEKLYFSVFEENAVQGYVVHTSTETIPTWRFEIPEGSQLVSISSREPDEKVASIGRVLGDRSVLYKYLNPNLLILAIATDSTLKLHLIDNVSGRILYELQFRNVDITKGVNTHVAENLVYCSYYSTGEGAGQSRGYRITALELYESLDKDEKYNTTVWTSFSDEVPEVTANTYLFDHPISFLTTTKTRYGITSRDLLIATPSQLISLPKRLLDPRRPILPKGGKVTSVQKEEGLVAYDPVIPDERKWTISHMNEVLGIRYVGTTTALLESTSLVFAAGLDLFWTRVAPSGTFDMLSEGFSKVQLLATIGALAIGLAVVRPIVQRKVLKQRWGAE